ELPTCHTQRPIRSCPHTGPEPEIDHDLTQALGGGLTLHDSDGTELARAGTDPLTPSPQGIATSRTGGHAVPVDGTWVCAVLAGSELLGSIVLTGRADLTAADRRLFERAALVAALLLLLRRTVAEAEDRVRGELLDDLLTFDQPGGRHDTGSLTIRARKLGINLSQPYAVLTLDTDNEPRSHLFAETVRRARSLGGLAGVRDGHVVLLVPSSDPGALAAELARDLGQAAGAPVTVGSAGPATGPQQLPGTYTEACRCLDALHALGRTGDGADIAGLGFLGVLLGNRSDTNGFVQRLLGPVLAYDQQRGTELAHTLDIYYAHGASLSKAKDTLHVHVNTVVQRLDRVTQLLGPDWNTPTRALELQLALRLHRLSGRKTHPPKPDTTHRHRVRTAAR
ncbi:PucR family transcriptional regulator, partial [Streptomyces sp. NPDC057474]|uniref:PucR family transcriptional regulator n=1 Tax=Streptomyces sp. NPDC057474 TaxID=3346144 RepID=UPI0036748FF7